MQHPARGERAEVDVAQGVDEVGGERQRPRRLDRDLVLAEVQVELRVRLGVRLGVRCVGVFEEQGEQLGGAGQPGEGEGAQLVGAGLGVARRDDLPDAVHDRIDRGGVTGLEAGDEGAQAVLVGAPEPD
ncbi:MAG: hypothetical protein ABWZ91_03035, partial [Nocardioides sp.]